MRVALPVVLVILLPLAVTVTGCGNDLGEDLGDTYVPTKHRVEPSGSEYALTSDRGEPVRLSNHRPDARAQPGAIP